MNTRLYIPDKFARALINKGWVLFVIWLEELGILVAHPLARLRINQNATRALLRRAEALARRMLVIEAMQRPLPAPRTLNPRAKRALAALRTRPVYAPEDVRYTPPAARMPKLALADPRCTVPKGRRGRRLGCEPPASRTEYCGIYHIRIHSTHPEMDARPNEIADSQIPIANRIAALEDVAARKAHHIRRMARWIARRRRQIGRMRSPLRPGRPPGWRPRLARRDSRVGLLGEADLLAVEALYCGRGPPVKTCSAVPPY